MSYKQSVDYEDIINKYFGIKNNVEDNISDLSFKELGVFLEEKRKDQYIPENMVISLQYSTYPPQYIIKRIKEMSPRDPVFKNLIKELKKACFRTSMMWKQSNTGIFDFLERYKDENV